MDSAIKTSEDKLKLKKFKWFPVWVLIIIIGALSPILFSSCTIDDSPIVHHCGPVAIKLPSYFKHEYHREKKYTDHNFGYIKSVYRSKGKLPNISFATLNDNTPYSLFLRGKRQTCCPDFIDAVPDKYFSIPFNTQFLSDSLIRLETIWYDKYWEFESGIVIGNSFGWTKKVFNPEITCYLHVWVEDEYIMADSLIKWGNKIRQEVSVTNIN